MPQALHPALTLKALPIYRTCGPDFMWVLGLEVSETWPLIWSLYDRKWNWISGQPTQCVAHSNPGTHEMGLLHPFTGQIGNQTQEMEWF